MTDPFQNRLARLKNAAEERGANWTETYGALVTILLCFLILLLSFSSVDASKWSAFQNSFSGTRRYALPVLTLESATEPPVQPFKGIIVSDAGDNGMTPEQQEAYNNFNSFVTAARDFVAANDMIADTVANYDRYMLTIRLPGDAMFNSGKAALRTNARATLDLIVQFLAETETQYSEVFVECHTDNTSTRGTGFNDNTELSVMRASNTLRYILGTDYGEPLGAKLSASGYGEIRPVSPNNTPEERAKNRRVDIVIYTGRPVVYR